MYISLYLSCVRKVKNVSDANLLLLHVYLLVTDHVFVSSLLRFVRDVGFVYHVTACESRSEIVGHLCNP
jgi:hypothetical protein